MTTLKACPECGNVVEVTEQEPAPYCKGCLGQGHMVAVMSGPELLASVDTHNQLGFYEVAQKRFGIASKLFGACINGSEQHGKEG